MDSDFTVNHLVGFFFSFKIKDICCKRLIAQNSKIVLWKKKIMMNLVNNEEIYMKMNQYQHQQTTKLAGFNFWLKEKEKKNISQLPYALKMVAAGILNALLALIPREHFKPFICYCAKKVLLFWSSEREKRTEKLSQNMGRGGIKDNFRRAERS